MGRLWLNGKETKQVWLNGKKTSNLWLNGKKVTLATTIETNGVMLTSGVYAQFWNNDGERLIPTELESPISFKPVLFNGDFYAVKFSLQNPNDGTWYFFSESHISIWSKDLQTQILSKQTSLGSFNKSATFAKLSGVDYIYVVGDKTNIQRINITTLLVEQTREVDVAQTNNFRTIIVLPNDKLFMSGDTGFTAFLNTDLTNDSGFFPQVKFVGSDIYASGKLTTDGNFMISGGKTSNGDPKAWKMNSTTMQIMMESITGLGVGFSQTLTKYADNRWFVPATNTNKYILDDNTNEIKLNPMGAGSIFEYGSTTLSNSDVAYVIKGAVTSTLYIVSIDNSGNETIKHTIGNPFTISNIVTTRNGDIDL